ncbi:hypothetical protein [Nonomuraea monospora]
MGHAALGRELRCGSWATLLLVAAAALEQAAPLLVAGWGAQGGRGC